MEIPPEPCSVTVHHGGAIRTFENATFYISPDRMLSIQRWGESTEAAVFRTWDCVIVERK